MARRALILWSAGSALACATAALSATNLIWRAPVPAPPASPAVSLPTPPDVPEPVIRALAVEVPEPGLPAKVVGFEAPSGPTGPKGFAIVSFFDPVAPLAEPFTLRPTVPDAPSVEAARPAIRDLVREVTALDPGLSRLAVRPPPRPAFIEARLPATAPNGAGIVEVRSPSPDASWTEEAAPATWSWASIAAPALPTESLRPERPLQSGVASWYGPGFHGRKTASGERFDQNALTAAHRSLPFGTKVKVVDQTTGRSIVVRINDRGPFSHGRVIDLSKGSAQALGMGGLARVRIVSAD